MVVKNRLLVITIIVLVGLNVVLSILYIDARLKLIEYENTYIRVIESYNNYRRMNTLLQGLMALELARTSLFLYISSSYSYLLSSNNTVLHKLSEKLMNNTRVSIEQSLSEVNRALENLRSINNSNVTGLRELISNLEYMKKCLEYVKNSLRDGLGDINEVTNVLDECLSK